MESQELEGMVGKADSIVSIRKMIRTGSDEEGRTPSPMAWQVLDQLETELGRMSAEWISSNRSLILGT
jgi:hypothetical protein